MRARLKVTLFQGAQAIDVNNLEYRHYEFNPHNLRFEFISLKLRDFISSSILEGKRLVTPILILNDYICLTDTKQYPFS